MWAHTDIILFDGVCNFCHWGVRFVIDHDPAGRFRFASQQSETGQALLARCGFGGGVASTMVLIENDRCHIRSDAGIRIVWKLWGPVRLLAMLVVIPAPVRDAVYDWVAKNRYRWFGKVESCRLPDAGMGDRFI